MAARLCSFRRDLVDMFFTCRVFTSGSGSSLSGPYLDRVEIVGTGLVGATTAYALLCAGTLADLVLIMSRLDDLKQSAEIVHGLVSEIARAQPRGVLLYVHALG